MKRRDGLSMFNIDSACCGTEGTLSFNCELEDLNITDCEWGEEKVSRNVEVKDLVMPKIGFSIRKDSILGWYRPKIDLYLWKKHYKLFWSSIITVSLTVKDWSIDEE